MRKIDVHNVISHGKFNRFFAFIFFVSFLTLLFDGYDQTIYGSVLPLLMSDLQLTATQTGLLASMNFWGAFLGAFLLSFLADKIGRTRILMIGVVLYSLFTALCGIFADHIILFAACRFLAGMGIASIIPTCTAMISEYSPLQCRPFLLSINSVGIPMGALLSPLISLVLLPVAGWRVMFMLAAVSLLLLPFIAKIPETMPLMIKRGDGDRIKTILNKANPEYVYEENDIYEVQASDNTKVSFLTIFKNGMARNTIFFSVMFCVNYFINIALMMWLPTLITLMGYTLNSGLIITAIYVLGAIIATPIAGRMAGKTGYKKILSFVYAMGVIIFILIGFKTNEYMFAVLLFLFGGCQGIMSGLTFAFASANFPVAVRTIGLGFGSGLSRLGAALAPIIFGMLIQAEVSTTGIFLVLGFASLLGLICVSLLRRPNMV